MQVKIFIFFLMAFLFFVNSIYAQLSLQNFPIMKPPKENPFNTAPNINSIDDHSLLDQEIIPIHYLDTKKLSEFIKQQNNQLLSSQGTIELLPQENGIWIHDKLKNIRIIRKLILQLDQPDAQILIKARIVHIDKNYTKSLGTEFMIHDNKNNDHTETLFFPIIPFQHQWQIEIKLDALEKNGHARLISSPELIVRDRHTASITSGQEIPYQEQTRYGGTSTIFKKAALCLTVTPQILPRHYILLQLTLNQDTVSPLTVNGAPAIQTQQLSTQVRVKNQQTFVLGGIFEQNQLSQSQTVPGVSHLPIIGSLFRHHHRLQHQNELLIFVTPTLLHD